MFLRASRLPPRAWGAIRLRLVGLVAVSKVQPEDRIEAMLAAGQRVFGENRVQEAEGRWAHRRAAYLDLELRLIGPLQSNKAKEAVALFDVIETLDRDEAGRGAGGCVREGGACSAHLCSGEYGRGRAEGGRGAAGCGCVHRVGARGVSDFVVEGLMCIPPAEEPAGPHFALLAKIAARNGVAKLSMGMSADYETAVMFGATSVRVGSALFGARG
jgi:uncharacterized pyridoxal phosphate-containing UPF0001 family protein